MARVLEAETGIAPRVFEASEGALKNFNRAIDRNRERLQDAGARLTASSIHRTKMYSENIQWVKEGIAEGYTFIDAGNPNSVIDRSLFYEMEKKLLEVTK